MPLKLKYEIAEMVEQMYRETDRIIEPLYPWVLVRPLPRSTVTQSKLIIMPEVQNKPNLESVVLVTWKPFFENVEKEKQNGQVLKVRVWNESDLKPGDHIVHPHHVGLPDSFLDEKTYRLIREEDATCILHYHENEWLKDQLRDALKAGWDVEVGWDQLMERIFENFDIVPKHGYQSLTTSGK